MTDREEWVFVGQRIANEEKLSRSYHWKVLDSKGQAGEKSWHFKKRLVSWAQPGSVFRFKVTHKEEGISVATGGEDMPEFVEVYSDEQLVIEWRTHDEATRTRLQVRRQNKREMQSMSSMNY